MPEQSFSHPKLVTWLIGSLTTVTFAAAGIWLESNSTKIEKLETRAQSAEVRVVTLETRYERIDEKLEEIKQAIKELKAPRYVGKRRTEE